MPHCCYGCAGRGAARRRRLDLCKAQPGSADLAIRVRYRHHSVIGQLPARGSADRAFRRVELVELYRNGPPLRVTPASFTRKATFRLRTHATEYTANHPKTAITSTRMINGIGTKTARATNTRSPAIVSAMVGGGDDLHGDS